MSETQAIILTSGVLTVRKTNRKTSAVMFKNLKVGDKVEFSIPISKAGLRMGRGTHASYITSRNVTTNEINTSSFNQLPNILNAFEFEVE